MWVPPGWRHWTEDEQTLRSLPNWMHEGSKCIHVSYGAVQVVKMNRGEFCSVAEMLVQEGSDLSKSLPGLGHAIVKLVLGMGHSFEDFKLGFYAGFA